MNNHYENTEIDSLTTKINNSEQLSSTEYEMLVDIVISIKFRNKQIKQNTLDLHLINLLKETRIELYQNYLDELSDSKEIEEFKNKFDEDFLNRYDNKEHLLDLYRNFLIKILKGQSSNMNEIKEHYNLCDLFVFKSTKNNIITSDKPGYQTTLDGQYIDSLKTKESIYTFPLSSNILCVWLPNYITLGFQSKQIVYQESTDENIIMQSNGMTANTCNERVFGQNKEVLEKINKMIPAHNNI